MPPMSPFPSYSPVLRSALLSRSGVEDVTGNLEEDSEGAASLCEWISVCVCVRTYVHVHISVHSGSYGKTNLAGFRSSEFDL